MVTGRLALILLACTLMAGCGTIFTGTTDDIKFTSNVPGVRLTIDKQPKGEVPITVKQSRGFMNGESFTAKFEADGYETQEFQLKRNFNTVAVLDITSIPTSGGIDFITGSLMRFEPTEYHIEMRKKGKGKAEFEREKRLWSFALVNYRRIQMDLAKGGGEHLESFASALSGTRGGVDTVITEHALRNKPVLLEASGPHDFLHRFNEVLAKHPELQNYQI